MPTVLDLYIHPSDEKVLNYQRWKNNQNSSTTGEEFWSEGTGRNFLTIQRTSRAQTTEGVHNNQREITANRNVAINPPPYEIAIIDLPSYNEVVERN